MPVPVHPEGGLELTRRLIDAQGKLRWLLDELPEIITPAQLQELISKERKSFTLPAPENAMHSCAVSIGCVFWQSQFYVHVTSEALCADMNVKKNNKGGATVAWARHGGPGPAFEVAKKLARWI